MSQFTLFLSEHSSPLIFFLLGLLLGATCIGGWILTRSRQQLLAKMEEMYIVKEEAAVAKGQLIHAQQNMAEQSVLLKEARLQLSQEFENLANRIFDGKQKQFDMQNAKTLSHSLDPLRTQINEFKQQVTNAYEKENAERNKLMGKIGELQLQTQKIGEDAVNLALALKGDNKSQGNWGEVILERLLEESGLQKGREYNTQVALKDDEGRRRNPDVIIYLPEDKQLVIDSKVSLVGYERYVNSDDETEKSLVLKKHIDSVRQHIKDLSRKNYENLQGIQTLDFVFIFMPIEAAFMLALQHEPALFREAYDKQIILVSPTTLMATLRTVANIWRYHKQHKNAELIATQAGGLYDQFALVIESLDDLGSQLDKTQKTYQKTRDRLSNGRGNLMNRVENLKILGAKAKKALPASVSHSESRHNENAALFEEGTIND
ncbi:DNA recombination protein RmuC [gamma proteobacterium IMCC1989]|nr:DNA recombination protein RmuC [gamma proteobacterium IMCC1989]